MTPARRMVAALYVLENGPYFGLDNVDPWPESRDARLYDGPYPVVAHPPCSRWCRLAGLVEARYGYKRGDDGGCFAAALESVRKWGGVLEHPAYTDAFKAYGLPAPPHHGWQATICGGWVCHVEQVHYGHPARKATWLYAHGVDELPALRWGRGERAGSLVSRCANHVPEDEDRPRISGKVAKESPPEFRDLMLSIAMTAKVLP